MSRLLSYMHPRNARYLLVLVAACAGFVAAALVGVAIAKSFVLRVADNATVTSTSGSTFLEDIVVNSRGHAIYELSGDSRHHPKCTKANGCFQFWPPVKVSSAKKLSKQHGVKGKLGTWRRNGFLQLTLGGHPVYTFSGDAKKDAAGGQGIKTFGGTWHVVRTSSQEQPVTTTGTSTGGTTTIYSSTTTTTMPTSTTMPCLYPPCY